jgi:DNA-binding transcriptional LysR family regulator
MRERNLDIGVLRSFLLIADGRSFSEAADLVGRSPSAVSLQIQRLEADLGAPVFRRNNREAVLTLTGERLLAFARRILRANDEAVLAFRSGAEARGPCASAPRRISPKPFCPTCSPASLKVTRMWS